MWIERGATATWSAAAEVFACAFEEDPGLRWAEPDASRRRHLCGRLYPTLLHAAPRGARLARVEGAPAFALWLDSLDDGPSPWSLVRSGALGLVVHSRPSALQRLARLGGASDRLKADLHARRVSARVLWLLAVSKDHRSQQLGAQLLHAGIEDCLRAGVGVYLDTASERAARLYTRVGMQPAGRTRVGADGPFVSAFLRAPDA